MLGVSQSAITRFKEQADRVVARAKRYMQERESTISTAIQTSEVSSSAFLFGLAKGKFGALAIPVVGLPIDLVAGLGLHILAFTGVAGKQYAHHLHAFADGALASFFSTLGSDVGVSMRTPADEARIAKQRSGMKGELSGLTGGAALADEELARMVAAGRR